MDSWENFGTLLYIFFIFWLRKDQRFCSTCWDSCGFQFLMVFLSVYCNLFHVKCMPSLLMLLKLNEWVDEVETIVYSALPLNSFNFACFHLFGEDPCSPLPSSAPFRFDLSAHSIKSIKTTAYLAPTRILQRSGLIPEPKIVFSHFSNKNPKIKIKLSYLFTSLKSVPIISHLAPYFSFYRDWRREPSPGLVGLATRLSVVWCSLEFYLISAWGRFER